MEYFKEFYKGHGRGGEGCGQFEFELPISKIALFV